jgi:hypothetical protein
VQDGAGRGGGVERRGGVGRGRHTRTSVMSDSCCHTMDVRVVDQRFRVRAAARCGAAPRRPRRSVGCQASAPAGSAAVSAPAGAALRAAEWSRMGNEGGRPGGLRAPCARGWSHAACVSQHVGAQEANYLGFLPETGRNSRGFANWVELVPETGCNPTQFGRSPAQVLRKTRALRRTAHESAHQAPGSSPSLPIRDQRDARRAAPAGADPEEAPAGADAEWRPPARTPTHPRRRGRPAARRSADAQPLAGGADAERPRRRPRQPRRLTPTRSHRTPPGPAAAASRPRPARRGVDTDPRSTIGARRRRSLPCRRSALPRGGRRR